MSESFLKEIKKAFKGLVVKEGEGFDQQLILQNSEQLLPCCTQLKKDHRFTILEDYTALQSEQTFQLVLRLIDEEEGLNKLTVKVSLASEFEQVESLCSLYGSADWYEREIYDMFGIRFANHPGLTRILLPDDWKGYPLRKDYEDEKLLKRQ